MTQTYDLIVRGGEVANHAGRGKADVGVIDGRIAHAVLLELLTMGGIGTMVLPNDYNREDYPEGTVFRKDDNK